MRGRHRRAGLAIAATAALLAAGCGGSSGISEAQLRARAGRACDAAAGSLRRIGSPKLASDARAFLVGGIAVIAPEVAELERLHPAGSIALTYRHALDASRAELVAMRRAVHEIDGGADPIATLQELERRLAPLELRAGGAWTALRLAACAGV